MQKTRTDWSNGEHELALLNTIGGFKHGVRENDFAKKNIRRMDVKWMRQFALALRAAYHTKHGHLSVSTRSNRPLYDWMIKTESVPSGQESNINGRC